MIIYGKLILKRKIILNYGYTLNYLKKIIIQKYLHIALKYRHFLMVMK